eukprot:GDKJ01022005.1.p1 GENE.GDKJ01022005.1~~GDKJ01022005.1.p1  ORF type:complete len:450 (+),score=74.94 GDKJ01022005.1:27-1352(+)
MTYASRLLNALNGEGRKRSAEERDKSVDEIFNKMYSEHVRKPKEDCASYDEIPLLFEKPPQNDSLAHQVRIVARHIYLQEKTREVSESADVTGVLPSLIQHRNFEQPNLDVIDYESFIQVGKQQPARLAKLFTPEVFLKFGHDQTGCIPLQLFYTYLIKQLNVLSVRLQLTYYDSVGQGYLREKDLEDYVFELLPTLSQLKSMAEGFYPFYVFTAVRRFFFFLDVKRRGGVRISDLLLSRVFVDFFEMRNECHVPSDSPNWFSGESLLRVYNAYIELDKDGNGTLSKGELVAYPHGVLTDVFVHRIFEEYQTYENEIDFKTFLDFLLAVENQNTVAGMAYYFKLLDMKKNNKIDVAIIKYFYASVAKVLTVRDFDPVNEDDVVDEIFDMIRPANPNYFTFQDLISCGQGGKVVAILTDAHAFWDYDNRMNNVPDQSSLEEV